MTSYSKDDYLGNNDPNNKLNGYSRIVDVAVLDSEEITAPKELDAHVISLDAIDITWDKFLNLFYHVDNNTFQINKAMAEDPDMTFVGQTIHTNNFHLPDSVLRLYGLDLGVELDCLDPCSSLEITQQILYYKSLANMCSVKCALTVNEIIETLVNRTESKFMEGVAGEHKYHKVFGYAEAPVYHQLVIQARFYNSNKMVKDIYVKFRFNVCFKGDNMIKNIIQSIVRPSFFPDEQEEEAMFSGDTSGSGDESSGPGSPLITGTLNANDVNGPVSYSIYGSGTTDNGGTYSIDGSGNWSYKPKPDFFGTDSFVVITTDTQGGTSEQTITVTVINVDDPAIFSGDTSGSGDLNIGSESPPITGTLTATDIDGNPVSYSISSGSGDRPKYGFAKIDGSGVWSYTPQPEFIGTDSFVVISKDTQGGTSTQPITVTVNRVLRGQIDTPLVDPDVPIDFTIRVREGNGNVTIDNIGNWTYIVSPDDSVVYMVYTYSPQGGYSVTGGKTLYI